MGLPPSRIVVIHVVFVLLATLLSTSFASDSFGFIIEPSDTPVVQGATARLYCSVNQPATTFMWVKDTVVISQTLQIVGNVDTDRYSVSYSSQSYDLIIRNARPEDAGTFKCVAFAGGAGILSRNAKLEVQAPPVDEIPTITSTVSGSIVVGETIEIICEIEGGYPIPEVELVRDDEILVVASGRLVYAWVTDADDDGAVFECRAQHSLWMDSRSSFLGPFDIVTVPPNIVLAPTTAEITIGFTASFVCSSAPAPRAVYRWFLNDVELEANADSSVVIDSSSAASVLRLIGTSETRGRVRCQVDAINGQASAESTLILLLVEIPTEAPSTPARETPSTRAPTQAPQETDAPNTRITVETPPTTAPREADASSTLSMAPRGVTTPNLRDSSTVTIAPEESSTGSAREPIPGGSNFNTIFVASVSAIVSLIGIILIAIIAAFCYLTAKRRRQRRADMYSNATNDGDVFYRSRTVGILRSWFSPVHQDTKKTLTSFEGPSPDQSPYNTVSSRR